MVLQNANNQLFSLFLKLKLAIFPDMTVNITSAWFCKTLKYIDCLFFERKNGKTDGINGEKHACFVLQNLSKQLFSPFSCVKPAKFRDMWGEIHAFTFTSKNSVKYLRLRPTEFVL
jgi:hypothetical protein